MRRNQAPFFATRGDLERLLLSLQGNQPLQFVLAGLFDSPAIAPKESLPGTTELESLVDGDANALSTYLIAIRGLPIEARLVPQRGGGAKYAVDQLLNPKTIAFRPGGIFGERNLIAGEVSTASDDATSLELFRLFGAGIRHQFAKLKSYFVGREAETLLDNGWRLTASPNAPSIYDLKRS